MIVDSITGEYKFPIEAYTSDFNGKATLSTLGNYILLAATMHAEKRGFGYENVTEHNRAWVLSRLAIEMKRYPVSNDVLEIHTWVEEVNKLFTLRNFAFLIDGANIGYARSIWAAIDLDTRRPCNLQELGNIEDYICDLPCPIDKPSKLGAVDGEPVMKYIVKYSDLDINKHLNSVKYIEHVADLFPLDYYKNSEISRFEIMYISEVVYGTEITFHQKETEKGTFLIEMRKDGTVPVCKCKVVFK